MVLFVLKHDASQAPGRKNTGIYIDSVRQHFGRCDRRVTVNHDLAEIRGCRETHREIHTRSSSLWRSSEMPGGTPAWQKK
jgi:hypothetical protein